MNVISKLKTTLNRGLPRGVHFSGSAGHAAFFGALERAPSLAGFFCGHEAAEIRSERLRRPKIPERCFEVASTGAAVIYSAAREDPAFPELSAPSVEVPPRIELKKTLPETEEALMASVKNSTTREDLRRIRKAGFTYRITQDPEDIREFHARFYVPLVNQQFPEDGSIQSLDRMLNGGGEIVCADQEGEWVAGIMNTSANGNYAMAQLGIRDADEEVRRGRVVSGLLVRSMQRAVELGLQTTTLGFSLPFLGKGPIWFKAKWGCALAFNPNWPRMQVLLDLRHATARRVLADCPLLHCEGNDLVAAAWLEPGEAPLKALAREAERYDGLKTWYMLGTAETLDAAGDVLAANSRVIPVPLDIARPDPLWLGAVLAPHRLA